MKMLQRKFAVYRQSFRKNSKTSEAKKKKKKTKNQKLEFHDLHLVGNTTYVMAEGFDWWDMEHACRNWEMRVKF
jgi:hypothetical protein